MTALVTSASRVRRPRRRTLVGLLACLLLSLTGAVVGAGPASAHAELITSNPADGSTVPQAPSTLTIELTEAVVPGATTVTLTDGTGKTVPLTGVQQKQTSDTGPARIYRPGDPGAPTTVSVALPQLTAGVYRVRWTTLSAADLHTTSGVVVFGVQRAVSGAQDGIEDGLPPLAEVALRWLGLLGAAAAAGALLVGRLGVAHVTLTSARRLGLLAVVGAGTAAIAGGALLAVQAAQSGVGVVSVLSASGYAWRWGLQEGAALLLVVAAAFSLRGRLPRAATAGVVLLAGYAGGTAAVGHAGAVGLTDPLRFVADVVHVAAALLWVGLVVSVAVLAADREARREWRPLALAIGRTAGWSVAVVTVTGLLLAAAQVVSLDALLLSTYGRLLLGKVALAAVGGVVALGTVLALRSANPVLPRRLRELAGTIRRRPGLRVLVVLEAALLVGVVVAAAGVASARPASGTEWIPSSEAVPLRSGQARDLVETLKVSPNRPGRNFVSVDVFSQYLPPPGPITSVTVVLTRPGAQPLNVPMKQDTPQATAQASPVGGPQAPWVGVTDGVDRPGSWTATVVVTRQDVETATASYPWLVVDPKVRLSEPIVSSTPWRTWLDGLAALLAVLVLTGWWLGRRALRTMRADADDEAPQQESQSVTEPEAEPESETVRESVSGSR